MYLDELIFGLVNKIKGPSGTYTARQTLEFTGDVVVVDSPGTNTTTVSVTAGGGGGVIVMAGDVVGDSDATAVQTLTGVAGVLGGTFATYVDQVSFSTRGEETVAAAGTAYFGNVTLPVSTLGSFTALVVVNSASISGNAYAWHISSSVKYDSVTETFTLLDPDTVNVKPAAAPHDVSVDWYVDDSVPKARIYVQELGGEETAFAGSITINKALAF